MDLQDGAREADEGVATFIHHASDEIPGHKADADIWKLAINVHPEQEAEQVPHHEGLDSQGQRHPRGPETRASITLPQLGNAKKVPDAPLPDALDQIVQRQLELALRCVAHEREPAS